MEICLNDRYRRFLMIFKHFRLYVDCLYYLNLASEIVWLLYLTIASYLRLYVDCASIVSDKQHSGSLS